MKAQYSCTMVFCSSGKKNETMEEEEEEKEEEEERKQITPVFGSFYP